MKIELSLEAKEKIKKMKVDDKNPKIYMSGYS